MVLEMALEMALEMGMVVLGKVVEGDGYNCCDVCCFIIIISVRRIVFFSRTS